LVGIPEQQKFNQPSSSLCGVTVPVTTAGLSFGTTDFSIPATITTTSSGLFGTLGYYIPATKTTTSSGLFGTSGYSLPATKTTTNSILGAAKVCSIPATRMGNSIEFLPLDRNKWQTGLSIDGCDTITTAVSCGKLYVFGELLFSEITLVIL